MSTSRPKRKAYHHGNLREALARAAADLLDQEGVTGVTLRSVARAVGVSHAAPYRHFETLEHLLAAVAENGFRELAEALEASPAAQKGEAYIKFGLAHPTRFRLMFSGMLSASKHPHLRETSATVYESLVEAFREQGGIAQPENAAAAAWALVHGLTYLLLDGHLQQRAAGSGSDGVIRTVLGAVRFAAAPQRSA
jgi:AcrR family transcriptional regulator